MEHPEETAAAEAAAPHQHAAPVDFWSAVDNHQGRMKPRHSPPRLIDVAAYLRILDAYIAGYLPHPPAGLSSRLPHPPIPAGLPSAAAGYATRRFVMVLPAARPRSLKLYDGPPRPQSLKLYDGPPRPPKDPKVRLLCVNCQCVPEKCRCAKHKKRFELV